MFRGDIGSGDFVGNSNLIEKMPPVRAVISSDLASRTYPAVRRVLTYTFAMVLMATQKYSFGCHVQESRRDALSMVRSCDPKPVYPSQVILISRRDEAQYFIVSQAKQYRLGIFINAPKNLRWSILFALLHSCSLVVHVLLRYDFGDEI